MREALRYLGVRTQDAQTVAMAEEAFSRIDAAVTPRHCTAEMSAAEAIGVFGSDSLARALAGCERAVLLAATLGAPMERLLRQAEAADMLRAAVLHACAAVRIEAYCDAVQASIPGAGRPRFSPGYGDFPLSRQRTLLRLTDAQRRIGLYLTGGDMLAPSKSVTAVLGIGPGRADALPGEKCARCGKRDCAYRKEGMTCG